MKIDERPDLEGPPTVVSVGLRLIDIAEISEVHQSLTADIVVVRKWKDRRLNGLQGCKFGVGQVWRPGMGFTNSGRVFSGLPEVVTVGPDGAVKRVQRYQGTFSFPQRLDRFPFGVHVVKIGMLSVPYGQNEVTLVVDQTETGRRRELTIPDWIIGTASGRLSSQAIEYDQKTHSRYDFEVSARRYVSYYVWKVFLPLILIVVMSWTVFWINPAQFGPQIGLSATSMLTLIAFQFATSNILPRLDYFTVLDKFIAGSTVLVFLALIESVTAIFMVSKDKKETALRLDRICRWAFPVAFVGLAGLAFLF